MELTEQEAKQIKNIFNNYEARFWSAEEALLKLEQLISSDYKEVKENE